MENLESDQLVTQQEEKNQFINTLEEELNGLNMESFTSIPVMIDFILVVESMFKKKINEADFLLAIDKKACRDIINEKLWKIISQNEKFPKIVANVKVIVHKFFETEISYTPERANEELEILYKKLNQNRISRLSNKEVKEKSEDTEDINNFMKRKTKDLYKQLKIKLAENFKTKGFPRALCVDYKIKINQRLFKILVPELREKMFGDNIQSDAFYSIISTECADIISNRKDLFFLLDPEDKIALFKVIFKITNNYINARKYSEQNAVEMAQMLMTNVKPHLFNKSLPRPISELTDEKIVNFIISSVIIMFSLSNTNGYGASRQILQDTIKQLNDELARIDFSPDNKFRIIEKLAFNQYFPKLPAKDDLDFLSIVKKVNTEFNGTEISDRFTNFVQNIPYKTSKSFQESIINIAQQIFYPHMEDAVEFDANQLLLVPYDKQNFSANVSILVSGFMSSRDDHRIEWENLILDFDNFSEFFFFNWDSKHGNHVFRDCIRFIGGVSLTIMTRNFYKLMQAIEAFLTTNNTFNKCKVISKYCGKLLAYIIASEDVYLGRTINLVSFSQGCSVVKYCLKELYELSKIEPRLVGKVQNVILMGGAVSLRNKQKWQEILKIVSGRVINCWSSDDNVLHQVYLLLDPDTAIGAEPLYLGEDLKEVIENYDFTNFEIGHEDYRNYMNEIIKDVKIF